MLLCIDKKILGTERNLLYDGEVFQWVFEENISDQVWWAGSTNKVRDIQWLAEACRENLPIFPPEKYQNAWHILKTPGQSISWKEAIPQGTYKNYLLEYVGKLWSFLEREGNSYYSNVLTIHRSLLQTLKRAKIHREKFNELIGENNYQKNQLDKFAPDDSGYCKKIIYDLTSSATGRLTVHKGPNVLTLKKELREIFTSSYPKGRLIQIDLKTLEPRIALYLANENPINYDDIYTDLIIADLKIPVSRSDAKKIVISTLYGMSEGTLSRMLPGNISADQVTRKIKKTFGINDLSDHIDSSVKQAGYFENAYGRKLRPTSAKINHYLQSTGVDVALFAFKALIEDLQKNNCDVKPLFIIHDALILDVNQGSFDDVTKICKNGFKVPLFNSRFPVKITDFI